MPREPIDGKDTLLMRRDDVAEARNNCPQRVNHVSPPAGMIASWEWFETMNKTHRQKKCDGCGLWLIWERKT